MFVFWSFKTGDDYAGPGLCGSTQCLQHSSPLFRVCWRRSRRIMEGDSKLTVRTVRSVHAGSSSMYSLWHMVNHFLYISVPFLVYRCDALTMFSTSLFFGKPLWSEATEPTVPCSVITLTGWSVNWIAWRHLQVRTHFVLWNWTTWPPPTSSSYVKFVKALPEDCLWACVVLNELMHHANMRSQRYCVCIWSCLSDRNPGGVVLCSDWESGGAEHHPGESHQVHYLSAGQTRTKS